MPTQLTQILFIYIFSAVIFMFAFAAYVIEGYGLSAMANSDGWMGFVPILRRYLEGNLTNRSTGIWMVSVPFAIILLLPAGKIAALLALIAVQVFYGFTRYRLFKERSNNAILHAILSAAMPFYFSIVIAVFAIKKT